MASRREVDQYRAALDEAVRLAQGELAQATSAMSHLPPEVVRDGMIEVFEAIAVKYGDVAASVSADFFEAVRPPGVGQVAALAEPVSFERAESTVRYAARHLWANKPQAMTDELAGNLQRYVENAARDTIHLNVGRDSRKPRWARIPAGGRTCAWCLMLASRGWVYSSQAAAGAQGNEFHNNDRCMIVPSWDRKPKVDGFDPDRLRSMYEAAAAEVRRDGLSGTDANIARRLRDMFPEELTDGVDVPVILRESSQGWPDGVKPVPGRTWRHVLKRHSPGGTAVDTFPPGTSNYEIARMMRDVLRDPDYTKPHPTMGEFVLNYFKVVDGRLVVVGTMLDGDGKWSVTTSFPPGRGANII